MVRKSQNKKKKLEQYEHKGKSRLNNPPAGLVSPETDKDESKNEYKYDPHLDPQLAWAGKAEHASFEVPTVSLHVHERIDTRTIIDAVRKRNGEGYQQESLFSCLEENPPLREAIEFYKHKHNWTNRLIAGDSLLVMNSLLEKEGMAGKIQMVYMDPPYGIKYGSNFQPFVNKRDVKDKKDEDLTSEPEMIKAFRDTWALGVHSYLTYMRDRLLLAKSLLHETGSIFVQISDENVHHVREIMDEVFGYKNHVSTIIFKTTGGSTSKTIAKTNDYILWYGKDISQIKYRKLLSRILPGTKEFDRFNYVELEDKSVITVREAQKRNINIFDKKNRLLDLNFPTSQHYSSTRTVEFKFHGKTFFPGKNRQWSVDVDKMNYLAKIGRLFAGGNTLYYKEYLDESPFTDIKNIWLDTQSIGGKVFVVQTNEKTISRCILMSTDPGDLVLDPTCGSGTTAYVAEQWGRRWITCDTSRVAVTLAKQRVMTGLFDYYKLAHPEEGVSSGFVFKTTTHISLSSIANNESPLKETLYDQPEIDNSRTRVTGPFTVEAVPSPTAKNLIELQEESPNDYSIARSGETLRQSEWRDELLKNSVRGKGGQYIKFSRVEPMAGTRHIQAEAETKPEDGDERKKALIVFGPEHAPMESRQVELALDEAESLRPKADMVLFAAFQFDPEAAKDIDETEWPGVTLLRVQMNADLLTEDLKKKRSSDDSFWLLGQPDVSLNRIEKGQDKGKYTVEVKGYDYYNTKTGEIDSGSEKNIALWMLDTDYDGRSLFPRQVFSPMSSDKDGWNKLAKNLKAEIDDELIQAYSGTVSLPFEKGENEQCAVKIVDDRGIESLRVIKI